MRVQLKSPILQFQHWFVLKQDKRFKIKFQNLDYEFLRTLRSLKEEKLEPKSAIRVAKEKLGWDIKPPLLVDQENGYESVK